MTQEKAQIHCEEYDKFLVPIYSDKAKDAFLGNGVIVGQYLITVSDVAQSKDKSDFTTLYYGVFVDFENQIFEFEKLVNADIIYDGRKVFDEYGAYDDLLIYKLNEKSEAFQMVKMSETFKLNDKPLELQLELCSLCYEFEGLQRGEYDCWIVSAESSNNGASEPIRKHCFKVKARIPYGTGYEGSALFRRDVLYGILVKKIRYVNDYDTRDYMALDARYIQKRIDEYETKQADAK